MVIRPRKDVYYMEGKSKQHMSCDKWCFELLVRDKKNELVKHIQSTGKSSHGKDLILGLDRDDNEKRQKRKSWVSRE